MEKPSWDTTLDSKNVHIKNVKNLLDIEAKDFNHRVVHAIIEAILKGDNTRAQRLLEQKLSIEEKSDNKSANMPKNVVDNIMSITQEYLEEMKANEKPTSVNIGISEKKSFIENKDTALVSKEGNYIKKDIKKQANTKEEYEPSEEFKSYTQEKQYLIELQAKEVLSKINEMINKRAGLNPETGDENIEEIPQNNDIINSHMTSEGLPKTSAPEENKKVDNATENLGKEKVGGLSPEDKRVQNAVYNIVDHWKQKFTTEGKEVALKNLMEDPLGWVTKAAENSKLKISKRIGEEPSERIKSSLAEILTGIEVDLLDLKKAKEKNIPLKIEGYNPETKKPKDIVNMKKGDVVSVTEKGHRTDFEILDINEDQISFKNLSNNIRGTMTKENMLKFISSNERSLKVEERSQSNKNPIILKAPKVKVSPEVKYDNKKDKPYEGSKIFKANWEGKEVPEELKAVADLEKELGYINPLVMQRYMKISAEEAQNLFDKYNNGEKIEVDVKENEEEKQKEIDALLSEIKALADQEKQIDNNLLNLYDKRKEVEKAENEEKYLGAKRRFGDPTEGKPFKLDAEKEIADINEKIKSKEEELNRTNIFNRGKIKKEIQTLTEQRDRFTKNAIDSDRKARPFLYFQTGKIRNPYVLRLLKRFNGGYDLRELGKGSSTEDIDGKFKEIKLNYLFKNNAGEGFHEYNSLGFTKIITGGEDKSEDASYKIMSPDGKIIADNIKGYQKATEVYNQARQEYLEKLEKEFNKK